MLSLNKKLFNNSYQPNLDNLILLVLMTANDPKWTLTSRYYLFNELLFFEQVN